MANAWGTEWVTGMNSMSNGPIGCRSLSLHRDQLGPPEQPRLFDAVAGQAQRERREPITGNESSRSRNAGRRRGPRGRGWRPTLDAVGVLAQPGEVGQHEVDAGHVGVGEHQAAVHEHQPARRLSMTMQLRPISPRPRGRRCERAGHQVAIARGQAVAPAVAGRAITSRALPGHPAGAGPSAGGHSPTGKPSWLIITLVGIGLGASSPVS